MGFFIFVIIIYIFLMEKQVFSKTDEGFMKMALDLAKKGTGTVSPNPMVGAVITKNDTFVAGGFHAAAGYNHAEINAIRNAREKFDGNLPDSLKMYVTLEPCSIHAKTPPCTDALIANKFSEIIVSTTDPNPKINGKGLQALKNAGIIVKTGLLEAQARKLNEIFFANILKKRPFICAKIASTLDGNLAAKTGDSKWITSEKSRQLVQQLRFNYGCVLTGINTIIRDNPFLYPRKRKPGWFDAGKNKNNFNNIEKTFLKKTVSLMAEDGSIEKKAVFNFKRAVLDASLDIDSSSNIVNTSRFIKTILFTDKDSILVKAEKYKSLQAKGVFVEPVKSVKNYTGEAGPQSEKIKGRHSVRPKIRLDLNEILEVLFKKYETTSIMIESGPGILTSFLKAGLIDKFLFFIAPKIIGGENPYCVFKELGLDRMADSINLKFEKIRRIENDLFIEAYPCLQG